MSTELPAFAGDGAYGSWEKATTGGRFISAPDSEKAHVLVDRHSKAMNKWRKESGFTEDIKVISWLLRQTD